MKPFMKYFKARPFPEKDNTSMHTNTIAYEMDSNIITETKYSFAKKYTEHFFERLLEELKNQPDKSVFFSYGKDVGLNNCDIQVHTNNINNQFVALGEIYRYIQELEKSIYKQKSNYYKSFDIELSEEERTLLENLRKDLDITNPSSFISRKSKEIDDCDQSLKALETQEWFSEKEVFNENIKRIWREYNEYLDHIQGKLHQHFLAQCEHLEQALTITQNSLNRLLEIRAKIESDILQQADAGNMEKLEEQKATIETLIGSNQKQKSSLIASLKEENEQIGSFYNDEIRRKRTFTENWSNDIQSTLKSITTNSIPKSRLYLFLLALAFFLSITVELAIMNTFTGDIIGVGTLGEKMKTISNFVNAQQSENPFVKTNNITAWMKASEILECLFLISFFSIPFLLSFVTKLWFDLKETQENPRRRRFFYVAAFVSLLYLLALSVAVVTLSENQRISGRWQFGFLLFFISLSVLLLSGYLLHSFLQGYENYKHTTKESFWRWGKSYRSNIMTQISQINADIDSKKTNYRNMTQQIASEKRSNHKEHLKFASLVIDQPILNIDVVKDAVITAIRAGYDIGINIRGKVKIDENFVETKSLEELLQLEQRAQKFFNSILNSKNEQND